MYKRNIIVTKGFRHRFACAIQSEQLRPSDAIKVSIGREAHLLEGASGQGEVRVEILINR